MRIKYWEIKETEYIPKDIADELQFADDVIMKFGYPHGKDGDEFLMIYALYRIRR